MLRLRALPKRWINVTAPVAPSLSENPVLWIRWVEIGLPEEGIAPGTKWEDIPDDWTCPDCGAGKSDFEMVEI
jgi:rubredoxin